LTGQKVLSLWSGPGFPHSIPKSIFTPTLQKPKGFRAVGRRFESCRAYQKQTQVMVMLKSSPAFFVASDRIKA
jgi:hypothetical protein